MAWHAVPDTTIADVGLSERDRCALELLGASTVGDLMRLDLRKVFGLPGFWGFTYTNLLKSRAALGERLDGSGADWDIATLGLPVKELDVLRQLGVGTVGDFLPLDLSAPRSVMKCSSTTTVHLKEV